MPILRCQSTNHIKLRRATNDPFYPPDNTFQQAHRTTRSQPSNTGAPQAHVSRPLSSADEAGPVAKKQRSTAAIKPGKLMVDEPLKKARARPALFTTNIFSSVGRRSQPTTSSRAPGLGKSTQSIASNIGICRSGCLLSSTDETTPEFESELLSACVLPITVVSPDLQAIAFIGGVRRYRSVHGPSSQNSTKLLGY